MQGKENARQPWKATRAHVRKHESILARIEGEPLPLTDRELWILGAAFTAISLGIVLLGLFV